MTASMNSQCETIYRARWVFPMSRPPLRDACLHVVDQRIVAITADHKGKHRSGAAVDLGDVAVFPRLVNAHTHLEFSDCARPIGTRGIELADWIGQVIAARGHADDAARAAAILDGLAESARNGVGLIGDIATPPCRYDTAMAARRASGFCPRVVSFAEVIGLSPERAEERWSAASNHQRTTHGCPAVEFAVSPHAPYSTPEKWIDRCVKFAAAEGLALAMHVAESPQERQLLDSASGRFADVLQAAGLWRDGLFPWPAAAPIEDLIERLAKAPRVLLVHGNDLTDREIDLIARHDHITVVFCPRTHDFFGYLPHPVARLLDAGVRVALGTDSRASNPDLSVWREFQFLLRRRPDLEPYRVLEMASKSGGEALLGAETKYGTIQIGASELDDLVAVRTHATTIDQVWRDCADQDLLCSDALWRT